VDAEGRSRVRGALQRTFVRRTPLKRPDSRATFGGANVIDTARTGFVPGSARGRPIFVQRGNQGREKSQSFLGLVWDATPKTSIAVDLWQSGARG
jgi:hypothetical protein